MEKDILLFLGEITLILPYMIYAFTLSLSFSFTIFKDSYYVLVMGALGEICACV